jgi:hypothetical protein
MNATEAIQRVTVWLRDFSKTDQKTGRSALRVVESHVIKTDNGWHVPFDNVEYLDGTDLSKKLIPTPVVFVPDDGGEITYAMDVTARSSGRDTSDEKFTYWAEVVNPEFDKQTFRNIDTPTQAILYWEEIDEREERTGRTQPNPENTVGPVWRGWPKAETPAQELRNYYRAEWIDRETFAQNLLDCEVFVPLKENGEPALWPHGDETARNFQVFSSSSRITAGHTRWIRRGLRGLLWDWLAEEPRTSFILDPGRVLQEQFHWSDPNLNPGPRLAGYPVGVEEKSAEATTQTESLFTTLTEEFEIEFPNLIKNHLRKAAEQTRDNGYELTLEECSRYAEGYARYFQNIRGLKNNRSVSWPANLPEHGLIAYYDNSGAARPTPWAFGKFDPQWTPAGAFAWHRVVGAYVGFAVGEAHALSQNNPSQNKPELGPLTKQLLLTTDLLMRSLPPLPVEVPENFSPHIRTDGWLSAVFNAEELPPTPSLVASLAATFAGGALKDSEGFTYSQSIAHKISTDVSQDAQALDTLTWLFRKSLAIQEFSYPLHVHLQQLREEVDGASRELIDNVLELRDDREASPAQQLEELQADNETLTSLGRALFAAARLHFAPQEAISIAATHSGNTALTSALTGALMGTHIGMPGLPVTWLDDLPDLGAVENMATDAFRYFAEHGVVEDPAAASDWNERYPRTSTD